MAGNTRPIHWIKAARKDFEDFPQGARDALLDALTAVAGIATPRQEIDVVRERLRRLKEMIG